MNTKLEPELVIVLGFDMGTGPGHVMVIVLQIDMGTGLELDMGTGPVLDMVIMPFCGPGTEYESLCEGGERTT